MGKEHTELGGGGICQSKGMLPTCSLLTTAQMDSFNIATINFINDAN